MKNRRFTAVSFLLIALFLSMGSYGQKEVFGQVKDGSGPLENVAVRVAETDIHTTTDHQGKYRISVETGDELQFDHRGMKSLTIQVEDVTRVLNIRMIPNVIELDNVTVEEKKRKKRDWEKEYMTNENIINTAYGYINAKVSATNVMTLTKKKIGNAPCILDVLRSRFPSIQVTGDCARGGGIIGRNGGISDIRGGNGSFSSVLFDVDGRISTDVPLWLNPSNIERMAVLNGRASAGFYSALGVNTVIVINTSLSFPFNKGMDVGNTDVRDYMEGPILTAVEVQNNRPTYLKELYESTSLDQARSIFEGYKSMYSGSPYFFLDCYSYFFSERNDEDFADKILENGFSIFEDNPLALKALAYIYEEQARFEKAHGIYLQVYKKRPKYAQSYFDMANSYRNLGDFKKSAGIYARYDYLLQEGFLNVDTEDFSRIIKREYNNLRQLQEFKSDLEIDSEKTVGKEAMTRIVFEWNDSEAEFELKFIDPDQNLYEWKHSLEDNPESVVRSKNFGYNITEKALDATLRGNYKVFVKYLGNKSLTPSYLKVTVYHDYGTPQQKRDIRVFKMALRDINQELVQINTSTDMVSVMP